MGLGNLTSEHWRKNKAYQDGMVVVCYPVGDLNSPTSCFLTSVLCYLKNTKTINGRRGGRIKQNPVPDP